MKFKINDIVYHRTLRHKGLFKGYDKWDKDTCYFVFITDDGFEEESRVSIDKLEKVYCPNCNSKNVMLDNWNIFKDNKDWFCYCKDCDNIFK